MCFVMRDFFNDFDKVNEMEKEKTNPQPEPEKQETSEKQGEQTEEKEETNDISKTFESLRNEISALKELIKNNSMGNSAEDENKTESEDVKE